MRRDHWRRLNERLDPATDYVEIYRNVVMHEFPWDMNQALSFALYRTYAVPGIGRLLAATGEFTERTQKRYDDTALHLRRRAAAVDRRLRQAPAHAPPRPSTSAATPRPGGSRTPPSA